jgi:peptidoglycan/xylan/chitin deacetylase (PgdA/CDA1 family)
MMLSHPSEMARTSDCKTYRGGNDMVALRWRWDAEERPEGFGTRTFLLCMFVLLLLGCGAAQEESHLDTVADADRGIVEDRTQEESNLVLLEGAPADTFYSNRRGEVLQVSPLGNAVEIRKLTGEILVRFFPASDVDLTGLTLEEASSKFLLSLPVSARVPKVTRATEIYFPCESAATVLICPDVDTLEAIDASCSHRLILSQESPFARGYEWQAAPDNLPTLTCRLDVRGFPKTFGALGFTLHKFVVVTYHDLTDSSDEAHPFDRGIVQFQQDLDYIAQQGYETADFQDVLALADTGDLPARDTVIINFDDAHLSHYEIAFPELAARHMKATFFVPTARVGTPAGVSWTQLQEMAAYRDAEDRKLFSIESHAHDHIRMGMQLPGETRAAYVARLQWQFVESKRLILENLGYTTNILATPFGNGTELPLLRSITLENGYRMVRGGESSISTVVLGKEIEWLQYLSIRKNTDISKLSHFFD